MYTANFYILQISGNIKLSEVIFTGNVILRTVILFVALLIMLRLLGKRQIGQLQPYEFALTLIAADLATTPMSNINTPLLWGIIPIYVLLAIGLFLSLISLKSVTARKAICGKPRMLIERGVISEEALASVRYTVNDLLEQLRGKDIFDISQVYYALLETNGEITVIPKSGFRPCVPDDFALAPEQENIAFALIMDGKLQKTNMDCANITKKKLLKKIKSLGFSSFEEILLLTYDGAKIYVHGNGENPVIKEKQCVI